MLKNKQIVLDMILNIIAAAIPVGMLQLIVYPLTAQSIGGEEYGLMLTIYSVWIMISNSLGNVLNNVRLLRNGEYEEIGINGDFNVLMMRWEIINVVVIGICIIFYCKGFIFIHIILGIIVSLLILLKAYLEVGFRLKLNYKAIVINNILQSLGLLIGAYITANTGVWEAIFICGYLMSCTYCIIRTRLLKEPFCKTELFKRVNKDSNKLIIASVISNMMTYADKLVLYPLMGGTAVSIYYTATILGKIVGMLTGPINSVILSYISRWKSNNKSLITKMLIVGIGICIIGYGLTLYLSRPVLGFLFPQWIDEVMQYIPITTANVLLLVLTSMLSPFILKFCDMTWQIVINGTSVVVYFACAFILWNFFGLTGFCFGVMAGNFIKLICMLVVYYMNKDGNI